MIVSGLFALWVAIIGFFSYAYINNLILAQDIEKIKIFSWFGVFSFIFTIFSWYFLRKEFLCPYIFFLAIGYMFMYGQCFLWAFDIPFQYKNLLLRNVHSDIFIAQAFSILCLLIFHLGALLASRKPLNPNALPAKLTDTDKTEDIIKSLKIAGIVLFFISVVPFFADLISTISVSMRVGYKNLFYIQDSALDNFYDIVKSFFVPSCFFIFIGYNKNKIIRILFFSLMVILFLVTFYYIGGRSASMLLIMISLFLWHYFVSPLKGAKIAVLAVIILTVLALASIVAAVRNVQDKTFSDFITAFNELDDNPVIRVLGECGWSLTVSLEMIKRTSVQFPFRFGSSYLYSLTTIIPNLGLWPIHPATVNANLSNWLNGILQLGYGPGFSPAGEAYLNFGWFGLIMLFFEGMLAGSYFSLVDKIYIKINPAVIAFVTVTLYFITFPFNRSSLVVPVRAIFFTILPLYIFYKLIYYTIVRRNKRSKSFVKNSQ